MAEKLSIQIALDGGAEIQRQLADIGDAGKKAFGDIAKSAEQVGGFKNIKPEEVTAKLQELGITGVESINKIQAAVKSAGRLESLVQGITTVESGLAALAGAAVPIGAAVAAAFVSAAKATIAFAGTLNKASNEAVKLGLTLEQFKQQTQGLEKLGIFGQAGAEGLKHIGQAAQQAKLDDVTKAFNELKEAATRGYGAQGTAQLKLLEETARGAGEAAVQARKYLVELGQPIPTDAPKTLAEMKGNIAAFEQQLRSMPDSLNRTNLAIGSLGELAGTKFIQALRKAEGSMSAAEAKAYDLGLSLDRLSAKWDTLGSVSLAPTLTAGINVAADGIDRLNASLEKSAWATFLALAQAALNPIGALAQEIGGQIVKAFTGGASAAQQMGQAGAQAGQQAAQGLELVRNPLTGMPELIRTTNQALQQTGQAGQQAGQQAAQGLELVRNPLTGMPELIRTTNQALQQTGQTAAQAGQQGAQGFQPWDEALGRVKTKADEAGAALQQAGQAGTQADAGVSAWDSLGAAIQRVIDKMLEFFAAQSKAGAAGGGGAPGPAQGFARGGMIGGRGSGTSDSNLAWLSRGEHIMPARVVRQPGVLSLLEALRRSGRIPGFAEGGAVSDVSSFKIAPVFNQVIESLKSAAEALQQAMSTQVDSVRGAVGMLANSMEDALGQLQANLQSVLEAILQAANTLQQLQPSGQARGGLLGGRGTGTSDSNLAWLSRGEYITPAAAVRQPGVLAFLEALRRSGGNLRAVLDGMGRFALGGMVPRPAFAAGGLASGMSHVTIQFPGLPAIGGLRASSEVVDELRKAAVMAQVRSGGRKPSRYS